MTFAHGSNEFVAPNAGAVNFVRIYTRGLLDKRVIARGFCKCPAFRKTELEERKRDSAAAFAREGRLRNRIRIYEQIPDVDQLKRITSRLASGKEQEMKTLKNTDEEGGTGYILMWLLGVPIPVLLLIFLLHACN